MASIFVILENTSSPTASFDGLVFSKADMLILPQCTMAEMEDRSQLRGLYDEVVDFSYGASLSAINPVSEAKVSIYRGYIEITNGMPVLVKLFVIIFYNITTGEQSLMS